MTKSTGLILSRDYLFQISLAKNTS